MNWDDFGGSSFDDVIFGIDRRGERDRRRRVCRYRCVFDLELDRDDERDEYDLELLEREYELDLLEFDLERVDLDLYDEPIEYERLLRLLLDKDDLLLDLDEAGDDERDE